MRPRRSFDRLMLGVVAFFLAAAAGCSSRPAGPAPKAAGTASTRTTHTYKLVGVVMRVSAETGQVSIAHEAIPGFMDAMTMPFTIKDHGLLEDVKEGDAVEGKLKVEKEGDAVKDYELQDLVVT